MLLFRVARTVEAAIEWEVGVLLAVVVAVLGSCLTFAVAMVNAAMTTPPAPLGSVLLVLSAGLAAGFAAWRFGGPWIGVGLGGALASFGFLATVTHALAFRGEPVGWPVAEAVLAVAVAIATAGAARKRHKPR